MSYRITISVLGPLTQTPCRPPLEPQSCQRPAYYTVTATRDDGGTSGGSTVCPEHLFATIGFFLGLPEGAQP